MSTNPNTTTSSPSTAAKVRSLPTSLSQKDIETEIEGGIPNQIGRMKDAYECDRFYKARFEEFPTRHKDARYKSPSVRRSTPIFNRIVNVLTMHLYKNGPSRKLVDPQVSVLLEDIYKRNNVLPKQRRLDALTCIGGFGGYQFSGATDPTSPVDMALWGAHNIAFWVDPDDPTRADSVAVVDTFDNQRRCRLYTRDSIVTYVTTKGLSHPAFGGSAYKKLKREDNPYRTRDGEGIVPFSFSHWNFPTEEFECNSPGLNLKELNQGINERLDNLGDSIYFNGKPIGVAEGVDASWTPPAEIRPGDFLSLPADSVDAGGNGPMPTLKYLMADLNYVTKDWEDQNAYLDHIMEMWGIPPSLIRMVQTGAASGAAIQAEQLPIIGWVEGRRTDWNAYEEAQARVAIQVAEAHLRNQGSAFAPEADQLQAALDDWAFTLRWPSMFVQLPGRDRDMADDWRLAKKIVSIIGIVQERMDVTEDEALDYLTKVKQQNDTLKSLGIEVEPPQIGFGQPQPFVGDQQQDPNPDEEEQDESVNTYDSED